ncbi:MAG: class I SAM-dependent methyltransferase [Chloroflexi bacterium]|nr:class I SAM-dependent methyltransferase [Chloroflexota bacterium]
MLRKLLEHPLTRGLDLDSPETSKLRIKIIQDKKFLKKIYLEWYQHLLANIPEGTGNILELGSGGGFIQDLASEIITSDIFLLPGLSLVFDAQKMPFKEGAFKSIVMVDVLHHIPDVVLFFREALRSSTRNATITMIEPWVSRWSKWVYPNLHHETFDTQTPQWNFSEKGPLSRANSALPWIIFARDRSKFETLFPDWEIERTVSYMPLRYLISGGVSLRSIMPGWSFDFWRIIERLLKKIFPSVSMFAIIQLKRK